MADINKSKWSSCKQCGDKIPPGLGLYHICLKCLTKGKK